MDLEKKAREFIELAKATAEKITSEADRAITYAKIAEVLIKAGKAEEAEKFIELAKATAEKITSEADRAITYAKIAEVLIKAGKTR